MEQLVHEELPAVRDTWLGPQVCSTNNVKHAKSERPIEMGKERATETG
jgi:hypothetical protein